MCICRMCNPLATLRDPSPSTEPITDDSDARQLAGNRKRLLDLAYLTTAMARAQGGYYEGPNRDDDLGASNWGASAFQYPTSEELSGGEQTSTNHDVHVPAEESKPMDRRQLLDLAHPASAVAQTRGNRTEDPTQSDGDTAPENDLNNGFSGRSVGNTGTDRQAPTKRSLVQTRVIECICMYIDC